MTEHERKVEKLVVLTRLTLRKIKRTPESYRKVRDEYRAEKWPIDMAETGYKVFHFGCTDDWRGKWLRAGTAPGFHVWRTYESALLYKERLKGGEVMPVKYRGELSSKIEPDGIAVMTEWLYVP